MQYHIVKFKYDTNTKAEVVLRDVYGWYPWWWL